MDDNESGSATTWIVGIAVIIIFIAVVLAVAEDTRERCAQGDEAACAELRWEDKPNR